MRTALVVALTGWAVAPVLGATPVPLPRQPFPDSDEYADAAWQLAHLHGYVTFVNERTGKFGKIARPPRYPFGTSVALAPFAAVFSGFPRGVQIGARAISTLYVVVIVWAAWSLGGWLAAAIAAVLVGSSPFAQTTAGLILSDPLAALLTVTVMVTLLLKSYASEVVTGLLAGAMVCVRLLGVISLPAAFFATRGWRRRTVFVACAVPLVGAMALYQWATFGSPFRSGYSYWVPGLHLFDLRFAIHRTPLIEGPFVIADKLKGAIFSGLCPCSVGGSMTAMSNVVFYPSVLAGLFWVFAPPLTGVVGLIQMVRARATPVARYALVTVALNVAIIVFYFDQAARFVAPAASLLLVYSADGLADIMRLAWRSLQATRGRAAISRGERSVAT